MNRIHLSLGLLWLILSPAAQSQNIEYPKLLEQLNTLLTEKQYMQAFQLADEHTFDFGGLPEFDLLSGFAAYGDGKYQEAVFAFERVIIERPASFLARYYLALCYRKVNNLPAAINELDKVLIRPLLDEQREKADKLKFRIERQLVNKKRSWGHSISAGLAFDSNVNSGTSEQSIVIPNLGEIDLFESSRETRDVGYSLSYQANYQYPISQYQWFKADIVLSHMDFLEHNEYRRNPMSFSLSYEHKFRSAKASTTAYTRPLLVEGQDYRVESGAQFSWNQELSKYAGLVAGISYSVVTKDEFGVQDFSRIKGSGSFIYKTKVIQSLTGHWHQDVSDDSLYDYNDKDVIGMMYQLTWPISDVLISNNNMLIEQHKYLGIHPLFLEKRDETLTMFSSQLIFNSSEKIKVKLHLNVQNKSSNLKLYSFNRAELGATWQYEL